MTIDGFSAKVRISAIEICGGKNAARWEEWKEAAAALELEETKWPDKSQIVWNDEAIIEMEGEVQICDDISFKILDHGERTTLATVSINFSRNPDSKIFYDGKLFDYCIGELRVSVQEDDKMISPDEPNIRAHIDLVLGIDMFEKLIFFRKDTLYVQPVFYREKEKKKVDIDDYGVLKSYIERVHFSPYLKEDEI